MVGIHPIHRKLATLAEMTVQKDGSIVMDRAEMKLLVMLLKENLMLISQLDMLKGLTFHAHSMGDHDWEQDLCKRIEEIELTMM